MYYIDSCVYLDFLERRNQLAEKLFFRLIKTKEKVFISTFLVFELKKYCSEQDLMDLFRMLNTSLIEVNLEDYDKAEKIAKQRNLPKGDVIHALLARRSNSILITNDKHFQCLKDYCLVKSPKDII